MLYFEFYARNWFVTLLFKKGVWRGFCFLYSFYSARLCKFVYWRHHYLPWPLVEKWNSPDTITCSGLHTAPHLFLIIVTIVGHLLLLFLIVAIISTIAMVFGTHITSLQQGKPKRTQIFGLWWNGAGASQVPQPLLLVLLLCAAPYQMVCGTYSVNINHYLSAHPALLQHIWNHPVRENGRKQTSLFGPQNTLLGAPEVLRWPRGARFSILTFSNMYHLNTRAGELPRSASSHFLYFPVHLRNPPYQWHARMRRVDKSFGLVEMTPMLGKIPK